jgi:NADH-quinone oxidoreductase subunit C
METAQLLETARALASGAIVREKIGPAGICVPVGELAAIFKRLHDDPALAFDMLLCHTAVDWLEQGEIEVFYHLFSLAHGHHLMLSSRVGRDNPVVPTASGQWRIAEWQERETYDMFGVLYEGHPDMRRLLLEDGWQGHPLRKDYRDDYMLRRAP